MPTPIQEIHIGLIKALIWKKKTRSGVRYRTSIVRLYRNGDTWKQSSRFGRDDIPIIRLALDKAHTWIWQHSKSDETQRTSSSQ